MADSNGNAPRGPQRLWMATQWTWQGVRAAWRHDAGFRISTVLAVASLPAAWVMSADGVERAVLVGSMLALLATVILKCAINAVVARFGAPVHELTERANRMTSGAVLLVSLNAALVWALVLR